MKKPRKNRRHRSKSKQNGSNIASNQTDSTQNMEPKMDDQPSKNVISDVRSTIKGKKIGGSYENSRKNAEKTGYFSEKNKRDYKKTEVYAMIIRDLKEKYNYEGEFECKLATEIAALYAEIEHLNEAKQSHLEKIKRDMLKSKDIAYMATGSAPNLVKHDPHDITRIYDMSDEQRLELLEEHQAKVEKYKKRLDKAEADYEKISDGIDEDMLENFKEGNELKSLSGNSWLRKCKENVKYNKEKYNHSNNIVIFAKFADEIHDYVENTDFYPTSGHWQTFTRIETQLQKQIAEKESALRDRARDRKYEKMKIVRDAEVKADLFSCSDEVRAIVQQKLEEISEELIINGHLKPDQSDQNAT